METPASSPRESSPVNEAAMESPALLRRPAMFVPDDKRLLFAVPKKGRLFSVINEILEGSGLEYHRENRLDVAKCKRLPVTLVFLPAADIATYVAEGNVDIGLTGEDIIAESSANVRVLSKLGIGKCRLSVQAPIGSVKSVKDLAGKRIVTSFPNLAAKYFAGISPDESPTKIKFVSGSVEVACALGLADGIVDLVETGTTMRAAGLDVVTDIMHTETVLIANPNTHHLDMVNRIQRRIEGYLLAKESNMLSYNMPRAQLDIALTITNSHGTATISPLDNADWVSVTSLIKAAETSNIMDAISAVGAKSIVVYNPTNCRM